MEALFNEKIKHKEDELFVALNCFGICVWGDNYWKIEQEKEGRKG